MKRGDVVNISKKSVLQCRGSGTITGVYANTATVKWDWEVDEEHLHQAHLEVIMSASGTKMSSTKVQLKGKTLGDVDCGADKSWDEWRREYNADNSPPPVPKELKCTCELRKVVNFGCDCEAGKNELAKERAS